MNDNTKAILNITAPNGQEFIEKGVILKQSTALNGVCVELYIPTKSIESEKLEYRLHPRICSVTVEDKVHEFQEPAQELEIDESYFLVNIMDDKIEYYEFHNESIEQLWLKNGLIHLTNKAAEQHLVALKAVNSQVAL